MTISNVASGSVALQTLRTNFQDQKNYLDQLQQSVSSGDLSGAQQAYNSLSNLIQNSADSPSPIVAESSSNSGSGTIVGTGP